MTLHAYQPLDYLGKLDLAFASQLFVIGFDTLSGILTALHI